MTTDLLGAPVNPPASSEPAPAAAQPAQSNPAGQEGGSPTPATPATPSWRDSLLPDLKNDKAIQNFKDVNDVVMAYKNVQGMMSGEKMLKPKADWSETQWKEFYKNAGVPEKLEEYNFKVPESELLDTNLVGTFKKLFHDSGVQPRQAEAIMKAYAENIQGQMEQSKQLSAQKNAQNIDALKAEFGGAYARKLQAANLALEKYGGASAIKAIQSSGMGSEPALVKMLAAMGESLVEKSFDRNGNPTGGMTPGEVQEKINSMLMDSQGAFRNENHAGHEQAVQEMLRLHQMVENQQPA